MKPKEKESDLTKTNFLARMSHEMRTPLNAIIGMCTIAQSSTEPEKIVSCLEKINEASLHLLGMINDVLDIVKIEAGNFSLTNAEANLPQILQKATMTKRFSLDAKKQNLILDFDPKLPETIIIDEQRLMQVLENLLSNAIKFTPPEGTITLSVKNLKEESLSSTLEITVSDTGIGISKEGLKTIFTYFEQVDGGMSRKYGGSGTGLTISGAIVKLMGGEITVSSEPGKGSSFSFTITVEKKTYPALDDSSAGRTTIQEASLSGFTILLAEDVEINREIVISILEDSRVTIDCAENGLEAVEKYKASPSKYDLILMDIHMPEMDGYMATTQIRALEAELWAKSMEFPSDRGSVETRSYDRDLRGQIPIIAMTANVFKDDVEKCLACGMTSHLGKPINHEDLMKTLDFYLLQKIPQPLS